MRSGSGGLVALFLISIVLPIVIQAGPLRLSPYRVMLLITIFPSLALWLQGNAGKIRVADIALLGLCLWTFLSYVAIHGLGRATEAGGIFGLETMGAYLLGRLLVRSAEDFRKVVVVLFWIVLVLLPLAIVESVSGHAIVLETFRKFLKTYNILTQEPRWGLRRVMGPFEHPILFGAFCGSILAMVYYVLGFGRSFVRRVLNTAIVGIVTFLSLSSGPLTSVGAQLGLIGWDLVLRRFAGRWKLLASLFFSAIVAIQIVANRSPAQILISFIAFNTSTAYNRLRIWQFGSASVWNHPLFGIGENAWARPSWMSGSIDMFWLVSAVQNGLLAGLLLQVAFFATVLPVIFRKGLDERTSSYRTGYVISLLGFYIAGWTVHYWNSVYVLLIFLLGCGPWFLDLKKGEPAAASPENPTRSRRRLAATGVEPASRRDTPQRKRGIRA